MWLGGALSEASGLTPGLAAPRPGPALEPDLGTHRPMGLPKVGPTPGLTTSEGLSGVYTHGESRVSPGEFPTPPRTGSSGRNT